MVASDVTPEHFDAGRRAAREAGVTLEWIEGDAASLPFADAEFDVVTSCFGAMFAPDHKAVANELLRVCRPGGVIGMMNFTPDGAGGDFFRAPVGVCPTASTGRAARHCYGEPRITCGLCLPAEPSSLALTRHEYVETAASAREYVELFRDAFGPMVAIYASLRDQDQRAAELDAAFLQFIARWNRGTPGNRLQIPYEYLLVVGRLAGC